MAFSKILVVLFYRITFGLSESMVCKQQLKSPPHNISVSSVSSTELIRFINFSKYVTWSGSLFAHVCLLSGNTFLESCNIIKYIFHYHHLILSIQRILNLDSQMRKMIRPSIMCHSVSVSLMQCVSCKKYIEFLAPVLSTS